jgi:small subunit ribosomal protein S9
MDSKYINATGRRKTAVACVFLDVKNKNKKGMMVNGMNFLEYFDTHGSRSRIMEPLVLTNHENDFGFQCKVLGGGKSAQADALCLAISRSLEKMNPELRALLKSNKLLTRDSREKERQKPGQKGARAKYQYGKR